MCKVSFMSRYFFSLCVGICLSLNSFAGHPSMEGMPDEMEHPAQPLPENALVPSLSVELVPDTMDGFNFELSIENFRLVIPRPAAPDSETSGKKELMHGHMHLYINNEKKARLYGNAVHIPASWLKRGINSVTFSVNNHMHGTFTHEGQEIQTTMIIDTNSKTDEGLIKNVYQWPKKKIVSSNNKP